MTTRRGAQKEEIAHLHFRSAEQPDQSGEASITTEGTVYLTFSPTLSIALREAERMAQEALEMGKGVGGFTLEGFALTAWGWTEGLVIALAQGVPASAVTLTKNRGRLTLRVRHAGERAVLTLEPGEYNERELQIFMNAWEGSQNVR